MSGIPPAPRPILEARGINKTYPGVVALDHVTLTVMENEVLGLIGENGAGKSTLMKILVGDVQPDGGTISTPADGIIILSGPAAAIRYGIGMVFQDGSLIPNLTVAENLFLCHEQKFMRGGLLSLREMRKEARERLAQVNIELDVDLEVRDVTPAVRQMVEIVRLLWLSQRYGHYNPLLILDEPTAILSDSEVKTLFAILEEIKKKASVILISHRLQEVVENSDRIVILKDGRNVTDMPARDAKLAEVEQLMVGHGFSSDRFLMKDQRKPEPVELLRVAGLSKKGQFEPIDFTLHRGEIVSLVGLIGSGKETIVDCLTGLQKAGAGRIFVEGRPVTVGSPSRAIALGIGHVPIDRRNEGLATGLSVADNINLMVVKRLRELGLLSRRKERANARHWVDECLIKTPSVDTLCANLSGGNQQKTVIAKWIGTHIRVLVLDHPTRGVDVGAKEEIYRLIRMLAGEGIGIIVMSDTLEEDIALSNKILILNDGRLVREEACPPGAKPTPNDIIRYIV
jgi:ribose transport system ATP-binding protein